MIASAFPGQFSYQELLNLDVRDLRFWATEAQLVKVKDQMKRIQAARLAMVDGNVYGSVMDELESQVQELELGKDERVKANWESLKAEQSR